MDEKFGKFGVKDTGLCQSRPPFRGWQRSVRRRRMMRRWGEAARVAPPAPIATAAASAAVMDAAVCTTGCCCGCCCGRGHTVQATGVSVGCAWAHVQVVAELQPAQRLHMH